MENISDDEDFVEIVGILLGGRRRRPQFRERPNHFEIWNNKDFQKRFRFTKQGARFIINKIRNQITSPTER